MKAASAFAGGLAGAGALTLVHESVKRLTPKAPRMDLLGMNALEKTLKSINGKSPHGRNLFLLALAGDLLGNALYYSLAGAGKQKGVWWRGTALGIAAGLGAVLLPKPLGLKQGPANRTPATTAMTVGLYLLGGIAASAVARLIQKRRAEDESENRILGFYEIGY
ncbi:hypothetical protein V9K67_16260 [Paraflavisolibacter sp. H34]|uniref:hypothetical protein n=1 Tax=Huijunlia imazamoxiresistens TaxID=3127457 RepID=UPI0030165DE5